MPDEAQPGFVTPVKHSPSSPVDNSVPEWLEDMSDEAQPGFDTPVKRRPASHIHGPASEWPESMTDEAYQTMLGKRPVHESAVDLPLDADRRSPARSYIHVHESAVDLPRCRSAQSCTWRQLRMP